MGDWHDCFECDIAIEFNVNFTVDGGVSASHHDGWTNFCSATVKTEFDTSMWQRFYVTAKRGALRCWGENGRGERWALTDVEALGWSEVLLWTAHAGRAGRDVVSWAMRYRAVRDEYGKAGLPVYRKGDAGLLTDVDLRELENVPPPVNLEVLRLQSKYPWSFSNLIRNLRLNLLSFRLIEDWLNAPDQAVILVNAPVQQELFSTG